MLRHDNADSRLTPIGRKVGLIDDATWSAFEQRQSALRDVTTRAERTRLPAVTIGDQTFEAGSSLADALRRPTLQWSDVADRFEPPVETALGERATIEIKVAGYVRRQEIAIERAAKTEGLRIPDDFDYAEVSAL